MMSNVINFPQPDVRAVERQYVPDLAAEAVEVSTIKHARAVALEAQRLVRVLERAARHT
jgi:hypothetical protein